MWLTLAAILHAVRWKGDAFRQSQTAEFLIASSAMETASSRSQHAITRVRHRARFRRLEVRRVESLTPRLRRVVLGGDELEGFTSPGFDDHVKLFFPDATGYLPAGMTGDNGVTAFAGGVRPESRDFTPRRYDAERRELTIDVSLHADGPATTWASAAQPGSPVGIGGPRGSHIVSDTFDWNLLIGDTTALPAIARRLEELPPHVAALAVIEVIDASERLPLARPSTDIHWVYRAGGTPALKGSSPISSCRRERALPGSPVKRRWRAACGRT